MHRDTVIAFVSDTHTGGSTALFPNKFWETEHGNHTPNKNQKLLHRHWEKCIHTVQRLRKDKRLIVAMMGDAIEGFHHDSSQRCLHSKDEQTKAHIELMDEFLRGAKHDKKNGDLLYYIRGTECHVGDAENKIGEDLGAEKDGNLYVFDMLNLTVNGRIFWLLHHGKGSGEGANEGNELRNWMRDIFWNAQKNNKRPPDFVVSGHTHQHTYNTYVGHAMSEFFTVHGMIVPSWQMKTRYAYSKMPVSQNNIGMAFVTVAADGFIKTPPLFDVIPTDNVSSVNT